MSDNAQEAINAKTKRILLANPEYISIGEFARMLGLSRQGAHRYDSSVQTIMVEGITLYHRQSASLFANSYKRHNSAIQRISFIGGDVARIQRICEIFYRTQIDTSQPELLALAKKAAKL